MEHVEDLLERYVVANLASALRGGQQRLTGGDDPGAVAVEHGIRAAGVLEELGGDVPFGREECVELAQPGVEYDLLSTCLRHGMGVLAYSPLAVGWLSGRYRKGQQVSGPGSPARGRTLGAYEAGNPANAAKLEATDALGALADEAGLTLVQLATAFAFRHPAVTSAIIGPRTMEHLDGYLAADGVELSSDVLDRIDEIVPPGSTVDVALQQMGVRHEGARRRFPPPVARGSRWHCSATPSACPAGGVDHRGELRRLDDRTAPPGRHAGEIRIGGDDQERAHR
jgi:hypothetical protein